MDFSPVLEPCSYHLVGHYLGIAKLQTGPANMSSMKIILASFLTATVLTCAGSSAAPFVHLTVVGRVQGSGDGYSTFLGGMFMPAGTTIDYQIVAQMAPVGKS